MVNDYACPKCDGVRRRVLVGTMLDFWEQREELVRPRRWCLYMIEDTPFLDWLVLTKRPQQATQVPMGWIAPNYWLGYSASTQASLDAGLPYLREAAAAHRFLSLEPLIGPIETRLGRLEKIDWLIVGGESGPGARPCEVEWIRSIVDQCRAAGVPCMVKQDSGPRPGMQGRIPDDLWAVKEYPT